MSEKSKKITTFLLKKVLPHVAAVAVMYLLAAFFFSPVVFDGKQLPQGDTQSWYSASQEVRQFREETGESSTWTNAMFSGMPTTTMYGQPTFNIFSEILDIPIVHMWLPWRSAAMLFFYLIGFYIFMVCIGAKAWLALLGAVAYGFASYNIIILGAGHITKAAAIAFMPPVIGGVILAYRKRYLAGALITLLFLGIEIQSSHQQITYYLAIIICFMILAYFINAIRERELPAFFKASAFLLVAAILAAIPSAGKLYPTYDYAKDTMRGGSELSITPENKQHSDKPNAGGLEIDYAFAWSYGKAETATILVPNCYGGGHEMVAKNSETARALRKAGYGSAYLPTYWGNQPFTEGPVYIGAIVCFLFILSLFVVKGPTKWWVIAACVVSIFLAWGSNFLALNEWLFHNLPFYNKFRTPSMSLVIVGVAMPILATIALKEIMDGKVDKKKLKKFNLISWAITAGICLIIMLLGATTASFNGAGDAGYQRQLLDAGFAQGSIDDIMNILRDYRQSMLYKDAVRSIVFVTLAFGAMVLLLSEKIKRKSLIISILALFILIDGWGVCKRYMGDDRFEKKRKTEELTLEKNATDEEILKDPSINYRVLNLASNTFNESQTSYFHKTIGGYSPAKLRRYQDMIDFYIADDMQKIYREIYSTQGHLAAANADQFKVLNMLNAKYVIVPSQNGTLPIVNPNVYGNAWFVEDCQLVANPDEEILALATTNLRDTAVVDQRWSAQLQEVGDFHRDSSATIVNTLCNPNRLEYTTKCATPQVAVFSEVFYDRGGWHAYVDGNEVPHFRANYILRAMVVPAGEHQITFKYIDRAGAIGKRIAATGSILVILAFAGALGYEVVRRRRKATSNAAA